MTGGPSEGESIPPGIEVAFRGLQRVDANTHRSCACAFFCPIAMPSNKTLGRFSFLSLPSHSPVDVGDTSPEQDTVPAFLPVQPVGNTSWEHKELPCGLGIPLGISPEQNKLQPPVSSRLLQPLNSGLQVGG